MSVYITIHDGRLKYNPSHEVCMVIWRCPWWSDPPMKQSWWLRKWQAASSQYGTPPWSAPPRNEPSSLWCKMWPGRERSMPWGGVRLTLMFSNITQKKKSHVWIEERRFNTSQQRWFGSRPVEPECVLYGGEELFGRDGVLWFWEFGDFCGRERQEIDRQAVSSPVACG